MFDPTETPRVFKLPPGVDFAKALLRGLIERTKSPEEVARTTLIVNTRRLQRLLTDLMTRSGEMLLPRLIVLEEVPAAFGVQVPAGPSALRRQLDMTRAVRALLKAEPDIASESSAFDLAGSLLNIFDEMQDEGVGADVLAGLDISDQSGHWDRSLQFLNLVTRLNASASQRQAVEALAKTWATTPASGPVILAGSTGSRGTTRLLMKAVAALPQGALVLPGLDTCLTEKVWSILRNSSDAEDHPQYRFATLLAELDLAPDRVREWTSDTPTDPQRNTLVSLSMRPAPVTDQWMIEGRKFRNLDQVCEKLTLLEAPTPRLEADSIACAMRAAIEQGDTVALVTPDRLLTRRVTSALDRWGIRPDDSAGQPLHLTAPGRFLRHTAEMMGRQCESGSLMALLKHPITATGGEHRGPHLRWSRELELFIRRRGLVIPSFDDLRSWVKPADDDGRVAWLEWLIGGLHKLAVTETPLDLSDLVQQHVDISAYFAAGPGVIDPENSGGLWLEAAGIQSLMLVNRLMSDGLGAGEFSLPDYRSMIDSLLSAETVRTPESHDARVMIWGTLEARSQTADLVILGGLNESVWPTLPAPDPWLNRQMRVRAGLLLPERRIGLSAHDYQLAAAAKTVVLSRAKRNAEAETVPSRWVNRLTYLLEGLKAGGGPKALRSMRRRGEDWIAIATQLTAPTEHLPAEPRPAPSPPSDQRPRKLSITRIQTLIRDPFAIYAQYVLRLDALNPLMRQPDAALRGTFLHKALHSFINGGGEGHSDLMRVVHETLDAAVPWPATRRLWAARMARVSDFFVTSEEARRTLGIPTFMERSVRMELSDPAFTLHGRVDRIDLSPDGSALIYDYKTGAAPTPVNREYYDKQLPLTALAVEDSGVEDTDPRPVQSTAYISLGGSGKETEVEISLDILNDTRAEFGQLISAYSSENVGFMSRRDVADPKKRGDYDHLARFGEWGDSDRPILVVLA